MSIKKTYYEKLKEYFSLIFASGFLEQEIFEKVRIKENIACQLVGGRPLDLQEFSRVFMDAHPQIRGINELPNITEEQKATIFNSLLQTYYFWKTGEKIYHISNAVTSALMMTDVDSYPSELLKIPSPSIYISIPNNYFTLRHEQTGIHAVSGIFITSFDDGEYTHMRVLVTADANTNSKNEVDDCVFFYRIKVKKGKPLGESFEREGMMIFDKPYYYEQMQETLKFIFNFLVYLETGVTLSYKKDPPPPCTAKKDKKIRIWQREHGWKSKLGYLLVDDPTLEDLFKDGEMPFDSTAPERIQFKLKWIVRGHYHHYWTGKGRTILITKFLAPYWKGQNRVEA